VRNERHRLPFFLAHHRQLGVGHFLFVDNGSDDGTADYLSNQDDVSLWTTQHSYRLSRFGADWLASLQIKYGHGKWCLTLDADEIFIYPYYKTRSLHALVSWLEAEEEVSFGALMLDMYPKGPIGASDVAPGADPFKALSWFDSGNYTIERQSKLHNLWIQGGVRSRCFFHHEPRKAPTLSKTPLVNGTAGLPMSVRHTRFCRADSTKFMTQGAVKKSLEFYFIQNSYPLLCKNLRKIWIENNILRIVTYMKPTINLY